MRDEALIHFHYGRHISAGLHLSEHGGAAAELVSDAAAHLDPKSPGRSVAGFCAVHPGLVADIVNAPPKGWENWQFKEWDAWFGRINGVFLVDLAHLKVTQYPLYSCSPAIVPCDLTALPGRLRPVAELLTS